MSKFSIYDFLLEQGPQNLQPEQPQDISPQTGQEGSPHDQAEQIENTTGSIFADEVGKTVQNIQFKQKGVGVFDIIIKFAEYDVPLVVSVAGGKATVSKPPTGTIHALT